METVAWDFEHPRKLIICFVELSLSLIGNFVYELLALSICSILRQNSKLQKTAYQVKGQTRRV